MADVEKKDWKLFERLVARIEASIEEGNAVIKSPDQIEDLQTGEMREVDASIRKGVGSAAVLITVECRKRGKTQDVTWIEQLATKKRKIGAAMTIAVSSRGFSAPAVATAVQEGILTRSLTEVEENGFDWLNLAFHDQIVDEIDVKEVLIEFYDDIEDAEVVFDNELAERCKSKNLPYPLFKKIKDGTRYPIQTVFELAKVTSEYDPFEGVGEGEQKKKTLIWPCHDRGIGVDTDQGVLPVKTITIRYIASIQRTAMPITSVFRYASQSGLLSEGVEFDLPGVEGAKLHLWRAGRDGRFNVSLLTDPQE